MHLIRHRLMSQCSSFTWLGDLQMDHSCGSNGIRYLFWHCSADIRPQCGNQVIVFGEAGAWVGKEDRLYPILHPHRKSNCVLPGGVVEWHDSEVPQAWVVSLQRHSPPECVE